MAGQNTFGMILRDTREHKGISLDEAARRLRIRPDILRAIEENDFARMPPRGYTRNMVNAYARYLGLNPTEITTRYLDEMRQYQGAQMSAQRNDSGFDMPSSRRRGRSSQESSSRQRQNGYSAPQSSRHNPPYSEKTGRPINSDRSARNVAYDDYAYNGKLERNQSSRRRRGGMGSASLASPVTSHSGNIFAQSGPSAILSKLPIIIGALVVIALLVFIISSVVSCVSHKETTNVSNVPITGISDTTNSNSNSNANATVNETPVVETAPTSATFQYTVSSGKTAYIEIYEDGNTVPSTAEEVKGPETATYQVTSTLKFVTTSPDNVKITVDGTEVKPVDDSDGIYQYEVNFSDILADWTASHKTSTKTNTSKNVTNTTNAGNVNNTTNSNKNNNSNKNSN